MSFMQNGRRHAKQCDPICPIGKEASEDYSQAQKFQQTLDALIVLSQSAEESSDQQMQNRELKGRLSGVATWC
jgi:hypothetical protein